jgi:hypothetical protein
VGQLGQSAMLATLVGDDSTLPTRIQPD